MRWILMENMKIEKIIFFSLFILFIIYFVFCFPTYIESYMEYASNYDTIVKEKTLKKISSFFKSNKILCTYYNEFNSQSKYVDNIAYANLCSFINVFWGFNSFKKKWWYYLILFISLIIMAILFSCSVYYLDGNSA